jgi:hypothetical protein
VIAPRKPGAGTLGSKQTSLDHQISDVTRLRVQDRSLVRLLMSPDVDARAHPPRSSHAVNPATVMAAAKTRRRKETGPRQNVRTSSQMPSSGHTLNAHISGWGRTPAVDGSGSRTARSGR